jgi:hypothetical protein
MHKPFGRRKGANPSPPHASTYEKEKPRGYGDAGHRYRRLPTRALVGPAALNIFEQPWNIFAVARISFVF